MLLQSIKYYYIIYGDNQLDKKMESKPSSILLKNDRLRNLNGTKIKINLTNSNTASVLKMRQKYLMTKNELNLRTFDRTTAKIAGRPLDRCWALFFRSPTHFEKR
jgi:hypothetical protein